MPIKVETLNGGSHQENIIYTGKTISVGWRMKEAVECDLK